MTISLYGSDRNDVLMKMSQKFWLCTKNFVRQKQACRSSSVCVLAGVLTDLCFGKQRLYSCGTATESHRSFPVSFSGWPLKNHWEKPSSVLAKWESFSNSRYSAFRPSQALLRCSQGISAALRRKTFGLIHYHCRNEHRASLPSTTLCSIHWLHLKFCGPDARITKSNHVQ